MSNQTPLQKSIDEIEAKIKEMVERGNIEAMYAYITAKNILTDNLEYERKEFKDAWIDGRCGLSQNSNDYYTKTYEQ
jgi:hypothetical protein